MKARPLARVLVRWRRSGVTAAAAAAVVASRPAPARRRAALASWRLRPLSRVLAVLPCHR